MSIFETATGTCAACGADAEVEVVMSVNADRRPDLRAEILAGTFQAVPCPACGARVRVEPEFAYLDLGRGQWIAVHPAADVATWPEAERAARDVFEESFGSGAPAAVRELVGDVHPRVVFGWPALQERLLCADLGLDDVTVELLKFALLSRADGGLTWHGGDELRLAGGDAETLGFDLLDGATEAPRTRFQVPRRAYDEIAAAPVAWAALRAQLAGGAFVDMARVMVATGE
jgi:hypothetical protein